MYLEGVWKVSGRYLEGVWKVSEWCLKCAWKVSGECLEGVWKLSERCPKCIRKVSDSKENLRDNSSMGLLSPTCFVLVCPHTIEYILC